MNRSRCERAKPEDSADCIRLRGQTRQNALSPANLAALGITPERWSQRIADGSIAGHVCREQHQMIGYCFGSMETGEILVLAVLPEHEGQGAGRRLLRRAMDDLVAAGFNRLFLACSADPESRSHGFYRHLGWKSTGLVDANHDEVLEHVVQHVVEHDRRRGAPQ